MYEGSDSFGECHSESPRLSAPCHPTRATQVRVEAGFSKQSLPVALSPSPLSSCHSDRFQSHAAALTSLPRPFPAFCLNPAGSTLAQVMNSYYIIVQKLEMGRAVFFPPLLKSCEQQDQNTLQIIWSLLNTLTGCVYLCNILRGMRFSNVFVSQTYKQTWKRFRHLLLTGFGLNRLCGRASVQ